MARRISQRPLVVVWLCGAMLIFAASTGVAWNPPEADEHCGRMTVNGKPSGPEVVTYSARPYRDGPYYPKAHAYVLQHPIRPMRTRAVSQPHFNWKCCSGSSPVTSRHGT